MLKVMPNAIQEENNCTIKSNVVFGNFSVINMANLT